MSSSAASRQPVGRTAQRTKQPWLRWLIMWLVLGGLVFGLIRACQISASSRTMPTMERVSVVLVTATPLVGPLAGSSSPVEAIGTKWPARRPPQHRHMAPSATPVAATVPTATAALTRVPTGKVVAGGVNFRVGPGEVYTVQAVLPRGTNVTIIGKDGEPPVWWQASLSDGRTGWITANPALISGSQKYSWGGPGPDSTDTPDYQAKPNCNSNCPGSRPCTADRHPRGQG